MFDQVLADHQTELRAYLSRRFGSDFIAAEAVQDACVRLSGVSLAESSVKHPKAYIFRVATNIAIDLLRREKRQSKQHAALDDSHVIETFPGPCFQRSMEQRQRLASLQRAIADMPPRCREVFIRHKIRGCSHAEIASDLGITRNAVEKLIIRGMQFCRARLDEAGWTD